MRPRRVGEAGGQCARRGRTARGRHGDGDVHLREEQARYWGSAVGTFRALAAPGGQSAEAIGFTFLSKGGQQPDEKWVRGRGLRRRRNRDVADRKARRTQSDSEQQERPPHVHDNECKAQVVRMLCGILQARADAQVQAQWTQGCREPCWKVPKGLGAPASCSPAPG